MKKHTFILDDDCEDESPLLDDISILFFQTDTPNYLFADDLNHLYRLALARTDDIPILDTTWPLYTYHDSISHLCYYLIERPLTSTKILLIRGEGLDDTVSRILRDFNEPPVDTDPLNPDLQRHNEIILSYQQALTSVTQYNSQPFTPLSRKAAKDRQELDNLLTSILDHLDLNHL